MGKRDTFFMLVCVLAMFAIYTFVFASVKHSPTRKVVRCREGDTVVVYVGKQIRTEIIAVDTTNRSGKVGAP